MTDWHQIASRIGTETGQAFTPVDPRNIGGGCINTTVRLSGSGQDYFVKLNAASLLGMFEAEAAGLEEMAATATIRVPHPVCTGTVDAQAYLVLEYIEMGGGGDSESAGRQLAAMHRKTQKRFGWARDNTIGSTPQSNRLTDDWIDFWRDQRLGFQLKLAADNGHGGRLQQRGQRLLELFPAMIDHDPRPSLIHGDLWGGNLSYSAEGDPVIYDPAVYYADREADLAMTELFGSLGSHFYSTYNTEWPLDPGYAIRKTLYNLYHILNHLNLFGGGYGGQALGMIEQLLAELGH